MKTIKIGWIDAKEYVLMKKKLKKFAGLKKKPYLCNRI
jgi:hypothetical protein